jgi:hypothetical protein
MQVDLTNKRKATTNTVINKTVQVFVASRHLSISQRIHEQYTLY